jgi:hypothetical protein
VRGVDEDGGGMEGQRWQAGDGVVEAFSGGLGLCGGGRCGSGCRRRCCGLSWSGAERWGGGGGSGCGGACCGRVRCGRARRGLWCGRSHCRSGVGYGTSDGKRVVIGLWGCLCRLLSLWLLLGLRRSAATEREGGEREKQKRAAEGDGSSGSMSCGGQLRESQARALVRG